jgi:AcrR family transcriptional regulator
MSRGEQTHERIVEHACRLASRNGLDGLSIGSLAGELGLSKSGLFAHFGSKEQLQLQVLQSAVARFTDMVVRPALQAPRGEPRLRALFEGWMVWDADPELPGGCLLVAAAIELDDRPGPLRDYLVGAQRAWFATLAKAARLAAEAGHLRPDPAPEQLAFELYSVMLGFHHAKRLLRDPEASPRARAAFERLLASARC